MTGEPLGKICFHKPGSWDIKNEYYTKVLHTAVGREGPLAFTIHRFKLEVELFLIPRENCEGGEKRCKIEQPKVK